MMSHYYTNIPYFLDEVPWALIRRMIFRGVLIRGRVLIKKINFLTNMFLKANKDNGIIAEVIGGRKRENGLVVPCLYKC